MGRVRGKPFDGGDVFASDPGEWRHTGADGVAVEVNGTSSAEGHAATKFCARQSERIADDPEQRRRGVIVNRNRFSVEIKGSHNPPPKKLRSIHDATSKNRGRVFAIGSTLLQLAFGCNEPESGHMENYWFEPDHFM
jgi:hypothetical protein